MDSEATIKLIKLFYETPRAQEIYTTLRKKREAQKAYVEPSFTDEEVRSLSEEMEKNIDDTPEEERRENFEKSPCKCDDSMIAETAISDCDSKMSGAFQKEEKFDGGVQKEQKQRELLKWSLKIVNDKEIIVEGQRSGDPADISWRTSVIRDRISTNVVRSRKGTLYFLLGEIDKNDMNKKGFSEEIISMFNYGFPPNWRDVFQKVAPLEDKRAHKTNSDQELTVPVVTNDTAKEKVDEEVRVVPDIDDVA
ncbi:mis18-binding protein 1-like [Dendronephthya gigantea]|uniref:mis18-binding protein 1-like n=1 Tax=Dendronephthya gigantea TaxID=151771 RepID=UPI00106A604A|nr:mis18-binding protein 1-like [Dendronephthya gigantea]